MSIKSNIYVRKDVEDITIKQKITPKRRQHCPICGSAVNIFADGFSCDNCNADFDEQGNVLS